MISGYIKKIIKTIGIIIFSLILLYNFLNINNNKQYIELFGYKFIVVEKYQEQTGIEENTIIIGKVDKIGYYINDLVIININNTIYFHRIIDIKDNKYYITKGDGNYNEYDQTLGIEHIQGRVVQQIPGLGMIFKFAKSKTFSVIICLFAIMIFLYNKHIYKKKIKRRQKQQNKKSEM